MNILPKEFTETTEKEISDETKDDSTEVQAV